MGNSLMVFSYLSLNFAGASDATVWLAYPEVSLKTSVLYSTCKCYNIVFFYCTTVQTQLPDYYLHWTKKWICSNLPMSKDVANMIANLKQMWWRPYLLTFVSKYGLHHVYPLVNIIFDTYLLICKDEQIHFFMQC